jgi:hypothetical protein
MATDLSIYEGTDCTWTVTLKDSDEAPIDITGYTFLFVVKSNIGDEDEDALIKKIITTHTDPTNGVTQITINSDDTIGKNGKYVYDYQYEDVGGSRKVILTKAKFTILQRVGDSIS